MLWRTRELLEDRLMASLHPQACSLHRLTAAPPHRRTAAPPHRRTAAPPQVFGVLEEDVAQDARMHAQLASLSAVLPSQLDVNQRFLDTRFNRWDAAPIPNPNPNPKPDP